MTVRRAIVYAILLATAVSRWLFTHSARAQVRRVFADVERLAAKEPGEPVMECAGKSQALARHFKDGCTVIASQHGLKASYSQDDIAGGLLVFRSGATKVARPGQRRATAFLRGLLVVERFFGQSTNN